MADDPITEVPILEETLDAFEGAPPQGEVPGSPPRKAALAFIFVTVVLDVMALGVIIPVLPKLVLSLSGGDTAHAAALFGAFGTVFALMQFVFSPVLGALSDRFGRRPVVLISNFGLGLDYIVMALAPTLWWLFAGRVISGVCAASISAAGAYIADVTPPEKRAASFGMLGAAFGFSFVVGPALGGLLGGVNPRLPFWVAAGLSLANACYGLFILPESLRPDQRARIRWSRANPFGALAFLRSHGNLMGLAAVAFLSNFAHVVLPSTFVLFADYRFGWSARAVGFFLAGMGVCMAVVQGGLVRVFIARFGERAALLTGLAFGIVGFALYGVAPSGAFLCLAVPVIAMWGLGGPATQSMMTRHLAASEQGRLQGALTSLYGVAAMIGPAVFATTFSTFIRGQGRWHLPGAPFLLASAVLVAAWPLAWRFGRDG